MSMTVVRIINIQRCRSLRGLESFQQRNIRLCELDGTTLRVPIAGKRVKIFKKRTNEKPYVSLDKTDNEEQSDNVCGDAGSEESGLQLVVDIREESESATDEDE